MLVRNFSSFFGLNIRTSFSFSENFKMSKSAKLCQTQTNQKLLESKLNSHIPSKEFFYPFWQLKKFSKKLNIITFFSFSEIFKKSFYCLNWIICHMTRWSSQLGELSATFFKLILFCCNSFMHLKPSARL